MGKISMMIPPTPGGVDKSLGEGIAGKIGGATPSGTDIVHVLSPDETTKINIKYISITNSDTSDHDAQVYLTSGRGIASNESSIFYDVVTANSTTLFSFDIELDDPDSAIYVRSSSANKISFGIFGYQGAK